MISFKAIFMGYGLLFTTAIYQPQQKKEAVVIQGKVITHDSGKPVSNAHVFIIDGEEEAITDVNGEFSIRSWQKAPFRLTVEKHNHFQKESILIADPSRKQTIRLKGKP